MGQLSDSQMNMPTTYCAANCFPSSECSGNSQWAKKIWVLN